MPRTTHHAAVSRSVRRTSGLTLRGKPVARREHRELAGEVLDLPAQRVAEQHGGLVVEVVAGDDDVVAAVERGLVEQVALAQPARRARHPAGGPRRGRDVVAVLVAQRHLDQLQAALGGEVAGVRRRRLAVVADAEADVQAVGLVAELDAAGPTRPGCPCRRTRRRACGRRGSNISQCSIALATWRRHSSRKCSAQKLALCRGRSMIAGALHVRHFDPSCDHRQPPEITGRISTTSVVGEHGVSRHQCAVADDQVRLAVEAERRRAASPTRRGPASSSSRRGLRSSTFIGALLRAAVGLALELGVLREHLDAQHVADRHAVEGDVLGLARRTPGAAGSGPTRPRRRPATSCCRRSRRGTASCAAAR